jgi:hypothetical protein
MSSYSEKYKYIYKKFKEAHLKMALGDEYLDSIGETTRLHSPMLYEAEYGILYLRDDAVLDLLNYIEELKANAIKTVPTGSRRQDF